MGAYGERELALRERYGDEKSGYEDKREIGRAWSDRPLFALESRILDAPQL